MQAEVKQMCVNDYWFLRDTLDFTCEIYIAAKPFICIHIADAKCENIPVDILLQKHSC